MLPRNAPAWLDRLLTWLEQFEDCFGHVAQRGAFRRYVLRLLGDSRRKSMSGMLARVNDSSTYQAFQHFITDAPWRAEQVWRRLRQVIPDREGVLILDGKIGRELVKSLMDVDDPDQITWVLRAGRGSDGFWEKMGFKRSETAMEIVRKA